MNTKTSSSGGAQSNAPRSSSVQPSRDMFDASTSSPSPFSEQGALNEDRSAFSGERPIDFDVTPLPYGRLHGRSRTAPWHSARPSRADAIAAERDESVSQTARRLLADGVARTLNPDREAIDTAIAALERLRQSGGPSAA
jgi:hypothetical protein